MSDEFAVHEPSRWSNRDGCMVALDLSPAEQFGRLRVVFPGPHQPPSGADAVPALRAAFGGYTPRDYLLIAGNMDLFAWAVLLAAHAARGKVKLLRWDNRRSGYVVHEAPDGVWLEGETV